MPRPWLPLVAALAAALALAAPASAHVCVAFLISVTGPHVHVLC